LPVSRVRDLPFLLAVGQRVRHHGAPCRWRRYNDLIAADVALSLFLLAVSDWRPLIAQTRSVGATRRAVARWSEIGRALADAAVPPPAPPTPPPETPPRRRPPRGRR
jgi:hypothetical protein